MLMLTAIVIEIMILVGLWVHVDWLAVVGLTLAAALVFNLLALLLMESLSVQKVN